MPTDETDRRDSHRDGRERSRGSRSPAAGDDVFGLVISIGLFGYFGFLFGLTDRAAPDGPVIPLFAAFLWTLRASAIGFAAALALLLLRSPLGNTLSGIVGLLSAVAFLSLAAWDWLDTSRSLAISPILLVLLGLWNGYASWRVFRDR
ncbi:MAG TPA: hypothetical protein PKC43_09755 [Phycisphaerales bacterium]|nr:hypothetical protein [Phycisphaerales bacterium]HMP37719.1 hypothetical protein [Phycisphaerales bacterium]